MTNSADDFFRKIYLGEDDSAATITKMGAKIAKQTPVKAGVTKVDVNPSTKIDAKTIDGKGFGRSYDRNNRPNDHRPGSVDFPSQKGPSNPQQRFVDRWTKAGLETSTRAAQRRQSGNYTNRKS